MSCRLCFAAQRLRRKIRGWKLLGESLSSEKESLNRLLSLLGPPIKIGGLGEIDGTKFKAAKILTISRISPVLLLTNIHPNDIIGACGDLAELDISRRATFRSKTPPQETYYLIAASERIAEALVAGPNPAPAEESSAMEPTEFAPVVEPMAQEPEEKPRRPLLGKDSYIPPRPTLAEIIADNIEDDERASRPSAPGDDVDAEWERMSDEFSVPEMETIASEKPELQEELLAAEATEQDAPPSEEAPAEAPTYDEAEPAETPAAPAAAPAKPPSLYDLLESIDFDIHSFIEQMKEDERIANHSNPALAHSIHAGNVMVSFLAGVEIAAAGDMKERQVRSLGVTRAIPSDDPNDKYVQLITDFGPQYRLYDRLMEGRFAAILRYGDRIFTLVQVA